MVYDKLEFKEKQLILPPGGLRSPASEDTGPAQQLTVQDGRFLWGVAWRLFPPQIRTQSSLLCLSFKAHPGGHPPASAFLPELPQCLVWAPATLVHVFV